MINYDKNSFLTSLVISCLEASYEIVLILLNIFGFSQRSKEFWIKYKKNFKHNYCSIFLENGGVYLITRILKEIQFIKL